jgi:nicotinate-nucleotide pyrophosphorylase (carboxylating)
MSLCWQQPAPRHWKELVARTLDEDLGAGDVSAACLPPDLKVDWYIEAQQAGVLCGVGIAAWLLSGADDDQSIPIKLLVCDGQPVAPRVKVLMGTAPASLLLSRERTALNFLMHLSGVATLTSHFVSAIEGTGAAIVDTRKTTPGLRELEKYAVRCGGGKNHRMRLDDGVMLKDNHIQAAGSVTEAIKLARESCHHLLKIEVECESPEKVDEAIDARADVVMLDNMKPLAMRQVMEKHKGRAIFEASGNVNLLTVREIAETGVDLISVGAITHSAPALSLHLEVE